ncbi:uncharacterized protein [Musca autumnalis]|uniref:uncharacterized protein n=1 Tax=Musca autumnalis TaxID=221902 RepID=UPI003CE9E88D
MGATLYSLHQMERSDGDTTVVRLEVGSGRALVLASVYMPYEEPNPPGILLRKLVEETMSKANLIVGCDANAHHFHWGSSDTNSRATTNWYPVEHTLTRHHITTIKSIDAISIITTLTQPTSHIHQQKSPHTSSHHHTLTVIITHRNTCRTTKQQTTSTIPTISDHNITG